MKKLAFLIVLLIILAASGFAESPVFMWIKVSGEYQRCEIGNMNEQVVADFVKALGVNPKQFTYNEFLGLLAAKGYYIRHLWLNVYLYMIIEKK